MCWLGSGSKFPILLNWVKLRPGVCDGAVSSTEGVALERVSMWGCLGFALIRGQNSEGLTFYQYFCWDLGPTFWCVRFPLPPVWFRKVLGWLCWSPWYLEGVVKVSTMFMDSWCSRLTMFFDSLSKSSRCLPNVGRLTSICLTFPVVYQVLLLLIRNLFFGVHQYTF